MSFRVLRRALAKESMHGSALKKFSRSFSKASTLGPSGATQLVWKASWMYFCSMPLSLILARQRCMRWLTFIFQVYLAKIHKIFHTYSIISHCVTYTRQLPSLSPRSTYFFASNWSSNFWMAATLMPVSSFMSASVRTGCDCIALRIFE